MSSSEDLERRRKEFEEWMKWCRSTPEVAKEALINGVALVDAEEWQKKNPGLGLPTKLGRENCRRGSLVVLLMVVRVGDIGSHELTFLQVRARVQNTLGSWYHGELLDDAPFESTVRAGRGIDFEPRHILSIHSTSLTN